MSHHYSGPDFRFPQGDARLDFTDLYAFPKPGDTGKSILIMNVHPSAGENPPEPTTTEPFAPEALYELKIDTDGDAIADIAYRVRFSAFERGAQTAILHRVDGPQAAGTGDGGRVIVDEVPVSIGREGYRGRRYPLLCRLAQRPFLLRRGGRARLRQVMAAAGSKWSAERGLPRLSCLSKKEMPTLEVNRRTMGVSLLPSRTLWSTQVDIRRLRRSAWRGHCSQMFCLMTLRARRLFPITAGHSPTMGSIFSCAFSQMERSRGTT
jgi:hypothetical protein